MTMSSEGDELGDVESNQSSDAAVILVVPEEVPVDLRTKLAVCLIHMGKKVPEVCVCVHVYVCLCVCVCVCVCKGGDG